MVNFLRIFAVVLRKEWRDAWRDGRSLRMAFLPPLYFVGMFVAGAFFVLYLKNAAHGKGSEPVELAVLGAEHLPPLTTWLEEQGIKINPAGADAYAQVEQKKLDYVLIIAKEAVEEFATGEPVTAWLVYDATNSKIQTSIGFIRQQIWSWNHRMGGLRLLSRGIDPGVANPLVLREMNIASEQKMGFLVMASLPMFLILTVFIGSLGFTADMMAGERERRSLEPLLITPASSAAVVLGKWTTSLILTLAVLTFELLLLAVALAFIPFAQLGVRVQVSAVDLLGIFAILAALAVIAVALQQLIAIFARSFKDAQTYMGLIVLIPLVPLLYTMINPGASEPWFVWVPVLGHQVGIKELLVGGPFSVVALGQLWLVAVPVAIILLVLTARQLRKPEIVYG